MPTKLERKLSKKLSRISVNPSHTAGSDSDSAGAISEDFFDSPHGSSDGPRDRSRSISPDGQARHSSKQQRKSQRSQEPRMNRHLQQSVQQEPRMNRHTTQQSLHQSSSPTAGFSASRVVAEPATPETLVKGCVVRFCQYFGEINHMPINMDINNRSRLLDLIDSARRQGRLPWQPGEKHIVRLSLSAKDIKVSDARGEAVLFRLHLHLLSAMSYFNDDKQHFVVMKSADGHTSKCILRIFHCRSKEDAEELCAIVDKAFDLLYTDATMAHLDLSIANDRQQPTASNTADTASLPGNAIQLHQDDRCLTRLPADQIDGQRPSVKAAKQKSSVLANEAASHVGSKAHTPPVHDPLLPPAPGPPMPPPPPAAPAPPNQPIRPPPVAKKELEEAGTVAVYSDDDDSHDDEEKNEKDLSEEAAAVVQRYMQILHKILLPEEMKRFASLVREYRTNLPVTEFCKRLKILFGPEKKFMLPGMRSFIPADDQFYFENFLQEEGVTELNIPDLKGKE